MNPDILVTQPFMQTLLFVHHMATHLPQFLVVGPRTDINLEDRYYTYDTTWASSFQSHYASHSPKSLTAIDYFIFKRGTLQLTHIHSYGSLGLFPVGSFPPFAIGRFVWDTWILSHILHSDTPTINGDRLMQVHVWACLVLTSDAGIPHQSSVSDRRATE